MSEMIPDPAPVLDLLEAFRRSKVMFAAVSLGVFDALEHGPLTAEELAARTKSQLDSLTQLVNACVALNLLSKKDGRFALSDMAATYLCQSSPRRLTGYIRYSNDVMWRLWHHLEDAVREGSHRWQQAFGWDGPIFSHFFRDDVARREFLMGMHGYGLISSPAVVAAFDLSRFHTMADLGGATGHLVIAACQRYATLRGIVFELPEVAPMAGQIVAQSGLSERITVTAGDFFVDELPRADLYSLGRILHDWNLEKVRRLLDRIANALPTGGGLLIAEKLLREDKTGPRWALLQSLNMLTCTEGKERSLSEYSELLRSAGFSQIQGAVTTTPLDAILAIK